MLQQYLAIIKETLREAKNKWTIAGFFIFSTVLIIIAFFVFQSTEVHDALNRMESLNTGNRSSMAQAVINVTILNIVYTGISNVLYVIVVCVGIFATSSLINSQFEKGTIDLLLSKPVPRWLYILGRYTGGILIIFFETLWFILGVWCVASISSGSWNFSFLLCTLFITLGFAGIYSIVVLIAVISRSSALSIIVGIGLFFIHFLISIGHAIETMVTSNSKSLLSAIANVLFYILPSSTDMGSAMSKILLGQPIEVLPIFLTIGLTVGYLGLGMWIFSKKEF